MTDALAIFSLIGNHIWQSAVLAGVLAGLLTARKLLPAQTRHTLAFATLIAAVTLPFAMLLPGNALLVLTVSSTIESQLPVRIERSQLERELEPPAAPTMTYARWSPPSSRAGVSITAEGAVERSAPGARSTTPRAAVAPSSAEPAAPRWSLPFDPRPALAAVVVALWLIGAAAMLARIVLDVAAAERLRARARPIALPRPLAHLIGQLDVRESADAPGPMVAGLFRPAIILPCGLLARTGHQELLGLIEHERAHVVRGDLRLAFLQRLVTALLWWSPAVHWIASRIDEEREMACDEAAAARVGDARAFARALTEHAEAQLFWGWPRLVVGATRSRSQLSRRVRRLLELAGEQARPAAIAARAGAGVLVAAIAATALATPRLIAQDDGEPRRSPRAPRTVVAPAAPATPATPATPSAPAAPLVSVRAHAAARADAARQVEQASADMRRQIADFARLINHGRGDAQEISRAAQQFAETITRMAQEMEFAVEVDVDPSVFDGLDQLAELKLPDNAAVWTAGRWGSHGSSPLMTAVQMGDEEIVSLLLESGADPNASSAHGVPLLQAIHMGQDDMVHALLEAGADPNRTVRGQGSPLMTAVRMGDDDLVEALAEAGADVNAAVRGQGSPLTTAIRSGDVDMVRLLVRLGADLNGDDGATRRN